MAFQIKGYVLEKPRVGSSTSVFTPSPDDGVLTAGDQISYAAAYPPDESLPGTQYMVLVGDDPGDGSHPTPTDQREGLLTYARFAWTKNEGPVTRFGYDGRNQRFWPLPGSSPDRVGTLATSPNVQLTVAKPLSGDLGSYPIRLSIDDGGSGLAMTLTIVPLDSSFTPSPGPPAGTVELSLESGKLNWADSDLAAYVGRSVDFQRQSPYQPSESDGSVGRVGDDVLRISPIPATGQVPWLRVGHRYFAISDEVPNEGAFSADPPAGHIEWAADTGRLKMNSGDVATLQGRVLYYVGIQMDVGVLLPTQALGTVNAPGALSPIPVEGGDVVFRATDGTDAVQFQSTVFVDALDPLGKRGQVQILRTTGAVGFSYADRVAYGSWFAMATVCDLYVEHGLSLRLYRSQVDPTAIDTQVKDVTAYYNTMGASLADPIIASPQVFLPAVPVEQAPREVRVEQGTGSFIGVLPDMSSNTLLITGSATFSLPDILTDALADFGAAGVSAGDYVEVIGGPQVGTMYRVVAVPTSTTLQLSPGVIAGAGSYRVSSPPASGYGHVIDFEQALLTYARRRNDVLVARPMDSGASQIPDSMLFDRTVWVEMETLPGSGTFSPLVIGRDALVEPLSGVVTFVDTTGLPLLAAASGALSGTTFTDTSVDFVQAGVSSGDILIVEDALVYLVVAVISSDTLLLDVAGSDPGPLAYEIRSSREILADRYFEKVILADPATRVERLRPLGTATNSPRLVIPFEDAQISRFRLDSVFSTTTSVVTVFTNPTLLPSGTVEVLDPTGELNFSSADLGKAVHWAKTLAQGPDYTMVPELGLVEFTERLLAYDEALIRYVPSGGTTPIEERATFIVRKELTEDHPTPTSELHFNPTGRTVASDPSPSVFRGGRPQALHVQVEVDAANSIVKFLSDAILTDALPHGATVDPSERVYVDYYVYEAFGGEKTTSVLQSPMVVASLVISSASPYPPQTLASDRFVMSGDWTATFPADRMLKVASDVYLIGSSSYDAGTGETTVILEAPQTFAESLTNPDTYVTSGPTRRTATLFQPAYFVIEMAAYDTVPRGMNKVHLKGDRTGAYSTGTVLSFEDGVNTLDLYEVAGAEYDVTTDRTILTLYVNSRMQYAPGGFTLKRSVRPILGEAATEARTTRVPVDGQPVVVFRKAFGQAGTVLSTPVDYVMDPAGRITLVQPLVENEEVSAFYVGHVTYEANRRMRVSYTHTVVPDTTNGVLGQVLRMDYVTFSPDTFFFRVVPMSEFRGEVVASYEAEARATSPSGGPTLSNASQPRLYDQGSPSLYFDEGHYANQDIVARSVLLFYNDAVNHLEDVLRGMDGRVVGGADGRFRFDGNIDNPVRTNYVDVTNDIDDVFKVSDAPYSISFTFPTFSVVSIGTYQAMWKAAPSSRFYPTWRRCFGVPALGVATGDPVLDTGYRNLTSVANLRTRLAWAQTTSTAPAGAMTVGVDNAQGSADGVRPPFTAGMKVVVQRMDGTFIADETTPMVLAAVGPTSLGFTAMLPAEVPVGSTIRRSSVDDSVAVPLITYYVPGRDYGVNGEQGQILYIKPFPPLDGSFPIVPPQLQVHPIEPLVPLSIDAALTNTDTAPFRFPALDGGVTDDDGENRFPLVGPLPDGETGAVGGLVRELAIIGTPAGTLRTVTTMPYTGTGSLDVLRTTLTNLSGPFPAPAPQVGDLVRILDGLNGATPWHRVVSVGANTVVVDQEFALQDSGFNFVVAVSAGLAAGTGTFSGPDQVMLAAPLPATVLVGHTFLVTGGPQALSRRQIMAINGTRDQITIDYPLTGMVGDAFRVVDSLPTFGYTGSVLEELDLILGDELASVSDERLGIEQFYDLAFTYLASGVTGQVSAASTTFEDPSADFPADGVAAGHVLYVRYGDAGGIRTVVSVLSTTTLEVDDAFPTATSGISYQVGSVYGVQVQALKDLYGVLAGMDTFWDDTQTFRSLILTPISVVVPPGVPDPFYYARATTGVDLATRETVVNARLADLGSPSGSLAVVVGVLSSSGRLYDRRYTWIDTRINKQNGTLPRRDLAIQNRLVAQATAVSQMVKVLAVQTAG